MAEVGSGSRSAFLWRLARLSTGEGDSAGGFVVSFFGSAGHVSAGSVSGVNFGGVGGGRWFGATGGGLMAKMLTGLEATGGHFGLEGVCIGHGPGTGAAYERV